MSEVLNPFGGEIFGIWNWLDAIIRVVIMVTVMTVVVMYLIYGERKIVARFQQRLGPTRTGPAGLWQGFADALKLVGKEDIRPTNADRWVFEFAPYATFVPVFITLSIPAICAGLGRPQPPARPLLRDSPSSA